MDSAFTLIDQDSEYCHKTHTLDISSIMASPSQSLQSLALRQVDHHY